MFSHSAFLKLGNVVEGTNMLNLMKDGYELSKCNLDYKTGSVVGSLFELRPFSSGEKVRAVGYNKDIQEVMIDIDTRYVTGEISSSIGGQIEPMAKSYHPMYFLVVTNEATSTVASDEISNSLKK